MTALWLSLEWPCLQLDYADYSAGQRPLEMESAPYSTGDSAAYQSTPPHQVHEAHACYQAATNAAHHARPSCCPAQRLPTVLLNEKTMQVVELDRLAAAAGIHHGMSLALCCALVADLQVLPYHETQSRQLCQQLAEALHGVCADLYFGPQHRLLLRLDPMLQLHHGLTGCLQAISQVLAPFNLRCNAGLAGSWMQAQLAAQAVRMTSDAVTLAPATHKALATQSRSRMSGRPALATSPTLFTALPLHSLATLHITLSKTSLAATSVEQLQRLGIDTLQDLFALPRAELTRRFPRELMQFMQDLQQTDARGLTPFQPSEAFDVLLEFVWQPTLWTHLVRPLATLLQQLERFLLKRQLQAHRVDVQLQLQEHAEVTLQIHAAAGEYQQPIWLKLVSQKLESLQLPSGVRSVRLQALQLQARQSHNQELWQEHKTAATNQTSAQLLALLQARLGSDAIKQPHAQAGHHIELDLKAQLNWSALEWQPSPSKPATNDSQAAASALPPRWTCRPLFLHAQPQPLPLGCRKVSSIERLSTPWWQGPVEQRDYFLAQSPSGQWIWGFKDAVGQYFCHGGFA